MIAEKIREIKDLSFDIIKRQENEEAEIDNFLDTILEIKKDLKKINELQLALDENLYNSMNEPETIWAEIDKLKELFAVANSVIPILKNSSIYSSIKNELKEVVYSLGLIKENYNDIQYIFKKSKSKENLEINQRLSKLI